MTAPSVEVHLFAAARAAVGQPMVVVAPGNLAAILDALQAAHPDFGRVRPQCSYLVDEVSSHADPASVEIADGSRVDVLPPFAGG